MGEWDNKFKRLFFKYPGDFTQWLAEAELVEELNPHLPSQNLDADALMSARRKGRDMLIHIECQRRVERTKTAFRMWQYNALATFKYRLPVLLYVIYLKKEEQATVIEKVPECEQTYSERSHVLLLAKQASVAEYIYTISLACGKNNVVCG